MLPKIAPLAGLWIVNVTSVPLVFGDSVPAVGENPSRWAITFAIGTAGSVNVLPSSLASGTFGIEVSNLNPQTFKYQDHGAMVGQAWFAFDKTGLVELTVIEQILKT